ncbi:Phage tail tube protein, TTP [Xenorhabdus japonica]|uniref:Phage tail tube protein, TTP n=1 Tax=Xenorhabdus japonica TaxID=53341 RepID=A0A1I5E391_9GAMM|nr:Phage tail tube protein, TTP [Xenorhabdus japonica]
MAYNIPNGSRVYIANKYGDEIKITSASNAEEVVLMVESATGIAKGDIVHVSSGWKKASGAYRVKAVTEKNITLEGLDTTDKNTFPVGGGAGSLKKVLAWEVMPQVMTLSTEGGE